jgi:hypothetical protein
MLAVVLTKVITVTQLTVLAALAAVAVEQHPRQL